MTPNPYEDRILRVLNHKYENPGADLSLDTLADVAAMSRFHWHRVFHAMTGESCAQAVRRVRMHRAAFWLVQTDLPVEKIAERVGYTNTQSFTRAFRDIFKNSPHAIRLGRTQHPFTFKPQFGDSTMYDVKIAQTPERRLAAHAHIGAYNTIDQSYEQISTIFTTRNLWPQARGMVAIYHDDPNTVPEAKLRSHAGVEVDADFAMPEGLEEVTISSAETAVLTFKGSYAGLQNAYNWFYGQWLPQSERIPADSPTYEVYLNSPMDTAPDDLRTEICMPLQPKNAG
ncbi:AraC family transcriptional regulator [Planktotalea sp.]|uniref:AraC family transcriptional regulator n=1 Tax=Planktotalea sp. TaxID=2029877 RepID=UPI003D6BBE18